MFRGKIASILEKELKDAKLSKSAIHEALEIPPSTEMGDYAFPCFSLAKVLRKNPSEIAKTLAVKIKPNQELEKTEAINGYVNFFLKKPVFAEEVVGRIFDEKEKFGHSDRGKGKKVVIESPGPNTNKPLHLGHMRNMALGISLSNIFKANGYKSINVDIINDRGIHIMKSLLAYKKFGKGKDPAKGHKPDNFVGDFYVLYSKEEKKKPKSKEKLQEELQSLLRKYEASDKETIYLLKRMNSWAVQGIQETYNRFGMHIDKAYYETEHFEKGKALIKEYEKKGLFEKEDDGSISINLEEEGLGKKVLLRADGTSIYITQDLYLALQRYKDFKPDKMIYVVGSEQIYHFKVLFTILKKLGFKFAENYYHLPYGMVYLPEGKMKSREGNVVDADNLMDETAALAKKEILRREPKLDKKDLDERAERIALGAINFFLIRYDALKDFTFNPEESISFEGETGPYIQYAHARASSILRKAEKEFNLKPKFNPRVLKLAEKEEHVLVRELSRFPSIVKDGAEKLKPDLIANYAYKLAQAFTDFYTNQKVLAEDTMEREERLQLVAATRRVLANALALINIAALEKM